MVTRRPPRGVERPVYKVPATRAPRSLADRSHGYTMFPFDQPPRRRRPHIGGPIAIALLSVCVAFAGGFHPAINLTIAALGGITAAVMLHQDRK